MSSAAAPDENCECVHFDKQGEPSGAALLEEDVKEGYYLAWLEEESQALAKSRIHIDTNLESGSYRRNGSFNYIWQLCMK